MKLQISNFMTFISLRNKSACLKDGTSLFSEVENFVNWAWKRTFWENIICPIPKIETLELLDIFFTSNFERSCNLDAKTTKNLPRQKLKGQDMLLLKKVKISEVSEFSILSYTQNRKLGNLGKCSFTSNFDSICNFFQICIFCKQTFNIKTFNNIFNILWLLILSHIFPEKFLTLFRIYSDFLVHCINIFIIFWGFLTFPC